MDQEHEIPLMLKYLFGDTAGLAKRSASERMLKWCTGFDGWLDEMGRTFRRDKIKQAKMTWKLLLKQTGKAPWELGRQDIEAHLAWMETEGYAASTRANRVGILADFYRWCDQHRIDPECEAGFNPAATVRRPKVRRYERAAVLSVGEVERLLDTMRLDKSELGKRDYAFMLLRLRAGAALMNLQHLKWGQIEHDPGGTWIRWRPESEGVRLSEDAWGAIREWLEASGRLGGIQGEDYVFAPLAEPGKSDQGSHAEDWAVGRPISSDQILRNLKLYGRLAGIEEEKLTLMALRRTGIRLKLEEGASIREIKVFTDSREEEKSTRYRLGKLTRSPHPDPLPGGEGKEDPDGKGGLESPHPDPLPRGEGKEGGRAGWRALALTLSLGGGKRGSG